MKNKNCCNVVLSTVILNTCHHNPPQIGQLWPHLYLHLTEIVWAPPTHFRLRCILGNVVLVLNLECRSSMTCRTCWTSAHKLNAVVVLQTLHKVDLQGGHTHVCSHHTGNGLTCLPDHPIKLLKWLDVNAPSMWLGEFTPEFTAVHSWSDYQRRVFHAKCKVCSADDVMVLACLSPPSCKHCHKWEGTSRGKRRD